MTEQKLGRVEITEYAHYDKPPFLTPVPNYGPIGNFVASHAALGHEVETWKKGDDEQGAMCLTCHASFEIVSVPQYPLPSKE